MMDEEKDAVRRKVGRPRKYATAAEKQKAMLLRKLESEVQIRAFIPPKVRNGLNELCKKYGMTQGEIIAMLVQEKLVINLIDDSKNNC